MQTFHASAKFCCWRWTLSSVNFACRVIWCVLPRVLSYAETQQCRLQAVINWLHRPDKERRNVGLYRDDWTRHARLHTVRSYRIRGSRPVVIVMVMVLNFFLPLLPSLSPPPRMKQGSSRRLHCWKATGTALPLLVFKNALWMACEPFSVQKCTRFQDFFCIYHINFFRGWYPRTSQKHPCMVLWPRHQFLLGLPAFPLFWFYDTTTGMQLRDIE